MNLNEIIAKDPYHRKLENVTKLYHGLENCCRCGCGGKYFKVGTVGFKRAINKMLKPEFTPLKKNEIMCATYGNICSRGVVYGENYIDIPYNAENDKCYTLYFD